MCDFSGDEWRGTSQLELNAGTSIHQPDWLKDCCCGYTKDDMPTVLVSGAANGLGAAFAEAYRTQTETTVITIDRAPIHSHHENVLMFSVDVSSQDSINEFTKAIKEQSIDLIIHSAGMRGLVPLLEDQYPDDVPACETLNVMDFATLTRAYQINAGGTFMLLRALLPNLKKAGNPKVIVMSSRMGSIGNNELPNKDAGSAYAYRASKAAMNAIVRSFAVDVPQVSFILCHPGRVETKLVRCKEQGAISVEESVKTILPLIERWNKKDSGNFYDRFGEPIQW